MDGQIDTHTHIFLLIKNGWHWIRIDIWFIVYHIDIDIDIILIDKYIVRLDIYRLFELSIEWSYSTLVSMPG